MTTIFAAIAENPKLTTAEGGGLERRVSRYNVRTGKVVDCRS
jgi:hypothetical protein